MVLGAEEPTRMTYLEYQLLLLSLVGAMGLVVFMGELALNRFQVLPLLFPGMFTVRQRRFYFFNFDISDGNIGKSIRADAKMLIRLTLCVALSYLWQNCVLEARQQVGTAFPKERCAEKADCFASEFHYMTFFDRQYQAVDCSDLEQRDFPSQVVVSCVRFVAPSAEVWLMQLAIAHSLIQLLCKSYVVFVWVVGSSKWLRRGALSMLVATFFVFIGLFFGEVVSNFLNSWLSFVMSLSIPCFLYIVWKDGNALSRLLADDAARNRSALEERLNAAFDDLGAMTPSALTSTFSGSEGSSSVGAPKKKEPLTLQGLRRLTKSDMKKFLLHGLPKRLKKKRGGQGRERTATDDSNDGGSLAPNNSETEKPILTAVPACASPESPAITVGGPSLPDLDVCSECSSETAQMRPGSERDKRKPPPPLDLDHYAV
jgi:hypothetical protein